MNKSGTMTKRTSGPVTQFCLFAEGEADGLPEPKPAKCVKCGFNWVERDALRVPTLAGCLCFWCGGRLRLHRGEKDFAQPDKHEDTSGGRAWKKHLRLEALCNGGRVPTGRLEYL